jgi:hypothetical protein
LYSLDIRTRQAREGEFAISKTVTLRIAEPVYEMFRILAERENRPVPNFIETAALRYIEDRTPVDEYEMGEIHANKPLIASLRRGHADAPRRRGRFV